jgi:hypothetical protein
MKSTVPIAMLLLMLVVGCTETTVPLYHAEDVRYDPIAWEKYEALYEYDELAITTGYRNRLRFFTTYTINRRLRIFSLEGTKQATIVLSKYSERITKFSVSLEDGNGIAIPLDLDAMETHYLESGNIVVPRVVPGCIISLTITFASSKPFEGIEYFFARDIPVLMGRFSLNHDSTLKYRYKVNESPQAKTAFDEQSENQVVVTRNNIAANPTSPNQVRQLFFNYQFFAKQPSIQLAIESFTFRDYHYDAPGWVGLASRYRKKLLSLSSPESKTDLKVRVPAALDKNKSDFQRADTILAYVQDHIALTERRADLTTSINTDDVLERGRGDFIEISLLLQRMLKEGGFQTSIFVTRPLQHGGFDPDIPSFRQLYIPLVIVVIEDSSYVALPFLPAMQLGEYPPGWTDSQALSLDTGKIVEIPPPTNPEIALISEVELSLRGRNSYWEIKFDGPIESAMRSIIDSNSKRQAREAARDILALFDPANKVQTATWYKTDRDEDLSMFITFANDTVKTTKNEMTHFSLRPFFAASSTIYNILAQESYIGNTQARVDESVYLNGYRENSMLLKAHCVPMENALFSLKCYQSTEKKSLQIGRVITIHKGVFTSFQLSEIKKNIALLDEIQRSSIVVNRPD